MCWHVMCAHVVVTIVLCCGVVWFQALRIKRVSLPPEHPDIAATLNNMGAVHQETRQFDKALEAYEEV